MKFERGPDPAPVADSSLDVREIGEEHVDDFGQIAASAYGMTPEAAGFVRGLVERSGCYLYMTFDGDTPAGTGAMVIDGDRAWFEWGASDGDLRCYTVVDGDESQTHLKEDTEPVIEALSHARVEMLHGQAHSADIVGPELVAEKILAFRNET